MATRKTRLVIAFVLMLSLVSFFSLPASVFAIPTDPTSPTLYTVTYNHGGPAQAKYTSGTSVEVGAVPTGYSGWQLNGGDPDLLGVENKDRIWVEHDTFTMPSNSVNFKAVTTGDPEVFTVTYNGNGGTGSVVDSDSPYVESAIVTVLANEFTRAGYEFTGWNTSATGGGIAYQPEATFTMGTSDVVLYAQWAPILYTVTYAPGTHGNFAPVSTTGLAFGATTPTAPETPGTTGWAFTAWSPVPTATVTGDAVYVAQWRDINQTYTVTYSPGDWGDFLSKTTTGLAFGTTTPAAPETPGIGYWIFSNWSPVPTETVTGDVEYVAQWRSPVASISLDKSVAPANVSSRTADVVYTFIVTNTGDYPLYSVTITDPSLNLVIEFPGTLATSGTESSFTTERAFSLSNLGTAGYGSWDGDTFLNTARVDAYNGLIKAESRTNGDYLMVSATDSAIVTYSSYTPPPRRNDPTPTPPPVVIPEPEVPAAVVPVLDEPIPAAPLPKTGGLDPSFLYGLGALLTGSGLVIKRRKDK